MKRWPVLKTVLIVTVIFMFIQLVLWTKFAGKEVTDLRQLHTKDVVRSLLNSWTGTSQLFMLDPQILQSILSTTPGSVGVCESLCQTRNKLITFGLIGNTDDNLRNAFHALRTKSFSAVDAVDEYPATSVKILTHVFLQHLNYPEPTIHVVIFYERSGFYWHSQIQLAAENLMFGYNAGSFTKFTLQRSTVDGIEVYIPTPLKRFLSEIKTSRFIECNIKKSIQFFKKYPADTSENALIFKRKARQLISKSKEVLDELNVPFWISSGTLLGWFRQCDIITHAQDVDIGIYIKDYSPSLIPKFKEAGLQIKHVFGQINDSFELSFLAGELKLDIFFFYQEKNYTWNGGTDIKDGAKYKYIFAPFELCWTTLLDLRVRIPCTTEYYIKDNYGPMWNTPKVDWDWKESPANVKPNGYWPKHSWEDVMQIFD